MSLRVRRRRPRTHLIWRVLAAAAAAGVLAIAMLFAAFWLERRTEIALPTPTGTFAVGRTSMAWRDDTHVDALAPVAGTKRELLTWIWYPAAGGRSPEPDEYVPARMRTAAGPPTGPMSLVTRDFAKVRGHSARDPEISAAGPPFPVAIMRGGASAGVVGYSALAEDLASHGYVVVGFDAPYRSSVVVFPDGRVMRRQQDNNPEVCAERPPPEQEVCMGRLLAAWTADIGFALDQLERMNAANSGALAGRLDLSRVGVFGHSLGGATAAQFCHDDPRCKAGINIDGQPFGSVVREGLLQPFLFLLSDHGASSDPVTLSIMGKIQSLYDRLPREQRHRVAIRGANHFTFSDDGALLKSHIVTGALRMAGILGIEGRRQLAVTAYSVRTFFDHYLKGGNSPRLSLSSPLYPEIEVLE